MNMSSVSITAVFYYYNEGVQRKDPIVEEPRVRDMGTQTDPDVVADLVLECNRLAAINFEQEKTIKDKAKGDKTMKTLTGFTINQFNVIFLFFFFTDMCCDHKKESIPQKPSFNTCQIKTWFDK